jgi:RNA polymerase sigma-70 factor (ECF subfamily)
VKVGGISFQSTRFQNGTRANSANSVTPLPFRDGEDILASQEFEAWVQLYPFDKTYVDRLRDSDPSTEQHFVGYFGELLGIKLRARRLPPDKVKDLSQETFIRVIVAIRREGGIRQPERLGAFVNSICNNVLHEDRRSSSRIQPMDDCHFEIPEKVTALETIIDLKRSKERVRKILRKLPPRDRELLWAIYLEEKEKDELCVKFHVDRNYLRVLVHRAKDKFKVLYVNDLGGAGPRRKGLL